MKRSLLILLCLIPFATACVYDFEADVQGTDNFVVVEGDIQVGGYTDISFYRNGFPQSFSATVEGEDGTVVQATQLHAGWACTLDTRNLDPSVRYRLRIEDIDTGLHYSTSWETVQPAPVIDSLSYLIQDGTMDLRATFHSDAGTPYYALSYKEEWEYRSYATSFFRYVLPGGEAPAGGTELYPEPGTGMSSVYGSIYRVTEPNPYNTCWATQGKGSTEVVSTGAMTSNKMVDFTFKSITRTDPRTSVKYRVKVSLRMISQGSYTYWESMDRASGQTGDLFAPTPSLQRGNIVCEEDPEALALGYVGASAWTSDELWIDANEVLFYQESPSIQEMLAKNALGMEEPFGVPMTKMVMWYQEGYLPWYRVSPESGGTTDETYYVWVEGRCLDCRTQGGTAEKPEDWPE